MAHKKDYKPEDIMFPEQRIVQSELVHEMKSSYIDYAMSVIVGRALPDVRDGLKPVHRRILYAMYEDGLTHSKPFRKSATTVGNVLGRYHPHGDSAVYGTMVRLAQPFSLRYTLVEGHGNFGSVDGDPPAAYRYTEARLDRIADEMMRDLDKNVVPMVPNFDNRLQEPSVLPSRFPNLLVNGSMGIAVGMATNIPPHNLGEVIDAVDYRMDHPDCTVDELMEFIKGPDFPTAAIIYGINGIKQAYLTGKGHIMVRSRSQIDENKRHIKSLTASTRACSASRLPTASTRKRLTVSPNCATNRAETVCALWSNTAAMSTRRFCSTSCINTPSCRTPLPSTCWQSSTTSRRS